MDLTASHPPKASLAPIVPTGTRTETAMPLRILLLSACCLALSAAEPAPPAEPVPPAGFSTARPQITITTTDGVIVAELFADQAPETVRTIIELAEGLKTSTKGGEADKHHFYDGLTFHRCIPRFMIQGGCPAGTGSGDPGFRFDDEINAGSLGLEATKALQDGQLHPQCAYMQQQFMQAVVRPAMEARGIGPETPPAEAQAAFQAVLAEVDGISLADFYRKLGYAYDDSLPTSSKPVRGVRAMANSGPDTNGSQFFITVADTPHLTGKHTVFGRVLSGMEVADAIAAVETGANNRPVEPVMIETIRLTHPASADELFVAPADQTED